MEFRIQDILKHILPGSAILLIMLLAFVKGGYYDAASFYSAYIKETGELWVFIFLAAAYFFGYFNDAVSSQLEYWTYGIINRPSFSLLNDRSKRYKLTRKKEIIETLSASSFSFHKKNDCYRAFLLANTRKDMNPSESIRERVKEYYDSYVFSRNMLTASIAVICGLFYLSDYSYYVIGGGGWAFLVLFRRWRQKAFCYSRQVFYACLFT